MSVQLRRSERAFTLSTISWRFTMHAAFAGI